jgi:hypothetical protein
MKSVLVAMLALALQPVLLSSAAVIYTKPAVAPSSDNVFTGNEINFELDITGDGAWDFNFRSGCCAGVAARTAFGFSILGTSEAEFGLSGPRSIASGYLLGALIGADSAIAPLQFYAEPLEPTRTEGSILLNYNPRIFGNGFGAWYLQEPMIGDRYLAFRWDAEDGAHYGYLHVRIPMLANGQLVIFDEWAWESEPGKSITAGAIPELGSVPLLVIGAFVLTVRRMRRHPGR